jgi:hypothetical protein
MNMQHKFTSPSAVQVKNWQKTSSIDEKLDVISWLKKVEWIVDIFCNIWLAHSDAHTTRGGNADRIKGSAKSGTEVFVQQDDHSLVRMNHVKIYGWESLTILLQYK